jgi:hypothetical protein
MKKLNLAALLLGAGLFMAMGSISLSAADMKCGAGKCGSSMKKPASKCGGDKAAKCGATKAAKCGGDKKATKCGADKAAKCGANKKCA